jgi:DNA-binding response OmpR family regulator
MTKRVLVVDDSPFVGEVVGRALTERGFTVEVVHELSDFEHLAAQPPDLVLMDVVLQEAFGDEVAALMQATGRITCPILLVSSLPEDELAKRASEAGLAGYISKREGLDAILGRVHALLGEPVPRFARRARPLGVDGDARRRLRRVLHVMAQPDRWNAAALLGELHALAGDADVAGDQTIADAARACHAVVAAYGSIHASSELRTAFEALAAAVGELAGPGHRRTVLVADDGGLVRARVLPHLDELGHVVMEARSAAEVRQRLRAADYDAVLVGPRMEPSVVAEIARAFPAAMIIRVVESPGGESELDASDPNLARRIRELFGG